MVATEKGESKIVKGEYSDEQEDKEAPESREDDVGAATEVDDAADVDEDQTGGPTLQVSVDDPPDGDDDQDQTGPTLQVAFQQNTDEIEEEEENQKPCVAKNNEKDTNDGTNAAVATEGDRNNKKRSRDESLKTGEKDKEAEEVLLNSKAFHEDVTDDPEAIADMTTISENTPETSLELALSNLLNRKEQHILKLRNEIFKLKRFISKRKQTYKRKRKDTGAPTRPLSAYNIFVQDKFAELSKENDAALKSSDTNAQLQRVPPASLVAKTGPIWKNLSDEEKAKYGIRAKADRKRYEEQMADYQPPDKQSNRKRNKTGYNMFFSAHVLRLKQSELGVPSARGSVARLVGTAWKQLSAEEKQYYEREADKHNGMNPVEKDDEEEEEEEEGEEEGKVSTAQQQQQQAQQQVQDTYAAHVAAQYAGHEIPGGAAGYAHLGHDPRAHHQYYYAQHHPAYHYDYGGHHQQHNRAGRQQYQYPQQPPHGYGGEYK